MVPHFAQSGLLREDVSPGHVGKTGKTMISPVTPFFAHTFQPKLNFGGFQLYFSSLHN